MLLQGSAALVVRTGLQTAYACLVIYSGLFVFGLMCLIWSGAAGLLGHPLSEERGRVGGRGGTSCGFRFHLLLPPPTRRLLLDLRALDALRAGRPLILAPHQPSPPH